MKFKLGAFVVVIVAALLVVPPLVGNVFAHREEHQTVAQLGNPALVRDGALIAAGDSQAAPYLESGHMLLPLRWFTDSAGLTVEWDSGTQTATLSGEDEKLVQITVGADTIQVEEESVPLEAPAVLRDGVTYIPARAVAEAFGWHVQYIEPARGDLLFLDNRREEKEPEEREISAALALLGPSRAQALADAVIFRPGSDHAMVRGTEVELKNADGKSAAPVQEEDTVWLPLEACVSALGGRVNAIATTDNMTAALDSLVAETRTQDDIAYITADAFSEALGMHKAQADTVVLTGLDLSGFAQQQAYLDGVGAALPEKRPEIPDAKGYIALTFDDGPTGGKNGRTVQLLNGLKERGVHATFFMCGYRIKDFHTHMDRYLADGHELGNHTMDHPGVLTKYTADKVYQQFADNNTLIASYCGQPATVGRPVGGAYNDMVLEQMKKAGLPCINWSVDTLDWKYRDAARIKKVIVEQAKDGDIVLMHDLHQPTVDGVLAAIDELQKQGYAFVTVEELARVKGVTLEPGKVYTSIK